MILVDARPRAEPAGRRPVVARAPGEDRARQVHRHPGQRPRRRSRPGRPRLLRRHARALTKLDGCRARAVWWLAEVRNLPARWVSTGQEVSTDLHPASQYAGFRGRVPTPRRRGMRDERPGPRTRRFLMGRGTSPGLGGTTPPSRAARAVWASTVAALLALRAAEEDARRSGRRRGGSRTSTRSWASSRGPLAALRGGMLRRATCSSPSPTGSSS